MVKNLIFVTNILDINFIFDIFALLFTGAILSIIILSSIYLFSSYSNGFITGISFKEPTSNPAPVINVDQLPTTPRPSSSIKNAPTPFPTPK